MNALDWLSDPFFYWDFYMITCSILACSYSFDIVIAIGVVVVCLVSSFFGCCSLRKRLQISVIISEEVLGGVCDDIIVVFVVLPVFAIVELFAIILSNWIIWLSCCMIWWCRFRCFLYNSRSFFIRFFQNSCIFFSFDSFELSVLLLFDSFELSVLL